MDQPIRWRYVNNVFVTGSISSEGKFVDVKPAEIEFSKDDLDRIWVALIPQHGVKTSKFLFTAKIVNVSHWYPSNFRVIDVEIHFENKKILLNLGRRIILIPKSQMMAKVISPARIVGFLTGILVGSGLIAIFGIKVNELTLFFTVALTVAYSVVVGFTEEKARYKIIDG